MVRSLKDRLRAKFNVSVAETAFQDRVVHPTINVDDLDPACEVRNLVINEPRQVERVDTILNLSFGMLGINSAVIVRRY